MLHRLLQRQLDRLGLRAEAPPPDTVRWASLLERVSRAYTDSESDRYTIERSLALSSDEMRGLYKQLEKDRDQLDALTRSLHEGVCAFDTSGKITFINAAARELLGLGDEPVAGRFVGQTVAFDPGSFDHTQAPVLRTPLDAHAWLLSDREGRLFDARLRRQDAPARDVECSITRIRAGDEVVGGVMTLRDVTDRKRHDEAIRRSEQRVAESEQRFRALVEGADVIFWEHNLTTNRFTYVSPQAQRMGYPLEAWSRPNFWQDILHPQDRDHTIAYCMHKVEEGVTHRMQYRMITADGSEVWIDDFVARAEDRPDGKIIRGVFIDITDRMRREQEMERARAAAEQASLAKTSFLANMSHEIRTPMTAILGYTDLLLGGGAGEEDHLDALRTIRRNGEHLLALINDILDIARIEHDGVRLEKIPCSPREVVESVTGLLSVRAAEKGLTLDTAIEPGTPEAIVSDPTRLRQIVVNLVGNALKFTQRGGVRVRVSGGAGPDTLVITVADTGAGMTREQIDTAFEPFMQGDTSMSRRYGGTGLGLAISRSLARMLGGDIVLDASPGHGTTATVTLECERCAHAQQPAPTAPAARDDRASLAGARILLAEDGPDNQRLITAFLKRAGAEVSLAENGSQALSMLFESVRTQQPFDLLLLDMQMPVLDGYAAATRLREAGSRIPIIALTAHAMRGDRERCLAAGCDEYLTKPVNRAELVAACAQRVQATPRSLTG